MATFGWFVVLIVAGCLAVFMGLRHPQAVEDARVRLTVPLGAFYDALRKPIEPVVAFVQSFGHRVDLAAEVERLKRENDELKGWQWRAVELERRLADLSALNRVVHEPDIDFVSAGVKARSFGIADRSVLIGAGSRSGVAPGSAVLSARGLVGMAYEVGPGTARVRALTAKKSRLLVSVGRRLVTVVARGNGARHLEMETIGGAVNIAAGDEVITAGEVRDGLADIPRGLKVGEVVSTPFGLRIVPAVDFDRIEYVSVLLTPVEAPAPKRAADASHNAREVRGAKVARRGPTEQVTGVFTVPLPGERR